MNQLTTNVPVAYERLRELLPCFKDRVRVLRATPQLLHAIEAKQPHSRRALPPARVRRLVMIIETITEAYGDANTARDFILNHSQHLLQNGQQNQLRTAVKNIYSIREILPN